MIDRSQLDRLDYLEGRLETLHELQVFIDATVELHKEAWRDAQIELEESGLIAGRSELEEIIEKGTTLVTDLSVIETKVRDEIWQVQWKIRKLYPQGEQS